MTALKFELPTLEEVSIARDANEALTERQKNAKRSLALSCLRALLAGEEPLRVIEAAGFKPNRGDEDDEGPFGHVLMFGGPPKPIEAFAQWLGQEVFSLVVKDDQR